ncbi:MAG: hydrogenase maturation nickel metallochaperone HypA [Ginsengibacter sp.]
MHEISICQSIVETLELELENEQSQYVREVHVKVGVLSCVDAKILSHVYSFVTKDTCFHKSILITDLVEVVAACAPCKSNFKVENYRFICPECDTPSAAIIEGNELKIHKIILEEPSYAEINE